MANYLQNMFPSTYGVTWGANDAAQEEFNKGNYGAGVGHYARGVLPTAMGLATDVGRPVYNYLAVPAADALHTAVTGTSLYPQKASTAPTKPATAPSSAASPGKPAGGQLEAPPPMSDAMRNEMLLGMNMGTDGKPLNGPEGTGKSRQETWKELYGKNGLTPNNDPYGQMAQMLSGQSQQRVLGSAEDNMRQLHTLRQLSDMTPTGGAAVLGDLGYGRTQADLDNAEKTQRWANENMLREAQNNPHLQHTIGAIIQANNSNAINDRNVNGRMAELGLQGAHQLAGYDMQGRNQLALEGVRGQNQLAGYGMQGRNQLANTMLGENLRGQNQTANTLLGYGVQGDNTLALERLRQADPNHAALADYYRDKIAEGQEARAFGKTPMGMRTNAFNAAARAQQAGVPQEAIDAYLKDAARRELAGILEREKHAQGGLVGYADGGAVDPIEEAYRRAGVQRPQQFRDQAQQQAQRPVQVSAPQAAPAPQREETWAEKARRIATGGLDRRMNGYADGGWVNEPDGSRYRMVNGVKNIEDPNGPKWGGYGTTGTNPLNASGGYGSFTNSRGTVYGNGGLSATPTAGQNWNNAGGSGPNSWSAPRDQGFASLPTAQPSYSPPTTGLRQNATMQPDRSWMSANERQTLDSFNQRMNGYAWGGEIDDPQAHSEGLAIIDLGKAKARQNTEQLSSTYRSLGLAKGGVVNVSGRQVLGAGTGKSDSIPAVIDGEREAGLSTGEFVMPVETVQHFGLDRLNKMVAQSRKGLNTGHQQA